MSSSPHEQTVRRFFDTVWNAGEVSRAREFIDDAFVSHNGLQIDVSGPDGYAAGVRMMRSAFPDLHTTVEIVLAQDDYVCVRGVDHGTNSGSFLGRPATGKPLTLTWIEIFRMSEDKIAEGWLEMDTAALSRQLDPEPARAPVS